MNTNSEKIPHYENRLYMGSETFFSDVKFSQEEIEDFIGSVQDDYDIIVPVRITKVTFVSGSDYREDGWEISAINYPKIRSSEEQICGFMKHLAQELVSEFNQHRICVTDSEFITMFKGLKY
jgi:hypothetical protein